MADEAVRDPLETAPPALTERLRTVTLSNGKTVAIEKWSWRKLWEMCRVAGDPDKIPFIARESVRPEDRDMVDALPMEDVLEIAAVSVDLNMSAHKAKNLLALARGWGHLTRDQQEPGNGTP